MLVHVYRTMVLVPMALEYTCTTYSLAVVFEIMLYLYHPWNPQARTTTETVLREAMQALVRVQAPRQARMLARIVVEIRAADIAVELEPYQW
jgi:hypothetical protein